MSRPLRVVDGNQTVFIDDATPIAVPTGETGPLEESTTTTITFADPMVGVVAWASSTVYDATANQGNADESYSENMYSVTSHRVPLAPGEKVGYQIKILYMDYLQSSELGPSSEYEFFIGNKGRMPIKSLASNRRRSTRPPTGLCRRTGCSAVRQSPAPRIMTCSIRSITRHLLSFRSAISRRTSARTSSPCRTRIM